MKDRKNILTPEPPQAGNLWRKIQGGKRKSKTPQTLNATTCRASGLHAAGAHDLKTPISATGFMSDAERTASR